MHLLTCPHCQASIPVTPSQAGDDTICPECQASVIIPKLGDVRKLPLADGSQPTEPSTRPAETETSPARRAGFLVLGLIATASLIIAGFCGIRWFLVDVPNTTEDHVAMIREGYAKLSAAELIREYEGMEKRGLDLPGPFEYKIREIEKSGWGRNAIIAGGIGGAAILGATLLAGSGRRKQR